MTQLLADRRQLFLKENIRIELGEKSILLFQVLQGPPVFLGNRFMRHIPLGHEMAALEMVIVLRCSPLGVIGSAAGTNHEWPV